MLVLQDNSVLMFFDSCQIKFYFGNNLICEILQNSEKLSITGRTLSAFFQFFLSFYHIICDKNAKIIYNFEALTEPQHSNNEEPNITLHYQDGRLVFTHNGTIIQFSRNTAAEIYGLLSDFGTHGLFHNLYLLQTKNNLFGFAEFFLIGNFLSFAAHRMVLTIFREFSPRCQLKNTISVISLENRRKVMSAVYYMENNFNTLADLIKKTIAISEIKTSYIAGVLFGSYKYGSNLNKFPFILFSQHKQYGVLIDDLLRSSIVAGTVALALFKHRPHDYFKSVRHDKLYGKRVWDRLNDFVHFPVSQQTENMMSHRFEEFHPFTIEKYWTNVKFSKPLSYKYLLNC